MLFDDDELSLSDAQVHRLPTITLSTVIHETLNSWTKWDLRYMKLWEQFKEHFENWTKNDFQAINMRQRKEIRLVLRMRDVWVENFRLTIAKSLYNTSRQDEKKVSWIDDINLSVESAASYSWDVSTDFISPALFMKFKRSAASAASAALALAPSA